MSLLRWGPSYGSLWGRDIDPFFGLSDILGDYDRQMRQLTREFSRLENQFMGGQEEFPLGLTSMVDRSAITPRIVDENGKKVAQYNFDIKGFRPEDVNIKTDQNGKLVVSARHEESDENHRAVREFYRMVPLPEGVQLGDMKSHLRGDGVLTISAPLSLPALEQQQQQLKEIPIEHHGHNSINEKEKK
ncbi:hypothetical protein BV898_04512 [Hypsibius exemplaris]|uniref:SHSP domain-containing protein n=1 Tax=Hypsibius exemplaris TaxID=2072580 RepID=A0A1W0X2R7_HYPEX|nr:hypothetical protein BV898_04512 [Hypsibius exemplaris]